MGESPLSLLASRPLRLGNALLARKRRGLTLACSLRARQLLLKLANLLPKCGNQLISLSQLGFQLRDALITRIYLSAIRKRVSLGHNEADYATNDCFVQ